MEIQGLRLVVTDADVRWFLASKHAPRDIPVENLEVAFVPQGVWVRGQYPTGFMTVPFDMLWEVGVQQRVVRLRLLDLKVVGLPASLLRGPLMNALSRAGRHAGVRMENEILHVELDRLLEGKKIPLKANLTGIICGQGSCVIEALAP
jgi:hypothetical protein